MLCVVKLNQTENEDEGRKKIHDSMDGENESKMKSEEIKRKT